MIQEASDVRIAYATLDADGALLTADPMILALNENAGGRSHEPLAIPGLAAVVRLARRLGVVVSRRVSVAGMESDLDLWARAQLDGGEIALAVSGWQEVPLRGDRVAVARSREALDSDLRWETDAALRLTFVSTAFGGRLGIDASAYLGKPLTALFLPVETMNGITAAFDPMELRRSMIDQPARLRETGKAVMLSTQPRGGDYTRFAGVEGSARIIADQPTPLSTLSAGFIAGLDKALRPPLARIVANADTINAADAGPIGSDYVDYAGDIAHAGRHLLTLVDDLVDLDAVERSGFSLALEPIDLADVARRAAGLLSVRAANSKVAIARPLPTTTAPVQGDFRRTLQIMVNLIGNAIRYSPESGVVTIEISSGAASTSVTVVDEGKGIEVADQERIFEKFERVDPGEPGGNGLGLYIARRLANAMGGDLGVESVAGQGARFTLTLATKSARSEDQHQS